MGRRAILYDFGEIIDNFSIAYDELLAVLLFSRAIASPKSPTPDVSRNRVSSQELGLNLSCRHWLDSSQVSDPGGAVFDREPLCHNRRVGTSR